MNSETKKSTGTGYPVMEGSTKRDVALSQPEGLRQRRQANQKSFRSRVCLSPSSQGKEECLEWRSEMLCQMRFRQTVTSGLSLTKWKIMIHTKGLNLNSREKRQTGTLKTWLLRQVGMTRRKQDQVLCKPPMR